jgi:hypothetical protein
MIIINKIKMKYFDFSTNILQIMTNNLLINSIQEIIETYVKAYIKLIDEEFGLSEIELRPLWEKVIASDSEYASATPKKTTPKKTTPRKTTPKKTTPKKTTPDDPKKVVSKVYLECPYIFTKGSREGSTCGSKPKNDKTYCSRHKKYEGQSPKVKKVSPPLRRSIVSIKKKPARKKKQDIILHKGPGGRLYHRPTGLVFGRDKIAIGTWLRADDCDNLSGVDEIVPLTDENIAVAKKYMFAFKVEDNVEDNVVATAAARKVTRSLKPQEAKKLKLSLSSAIEQTNVKAKDVADILCELQTRDSPKNLEVEKVEDESDYEEELLEEDDN